jgi:hypothetical protein
MADQTQALTAPVKGAQPPLSRTAKPLSTLRQENTTMQWTLDAIIEHADHKTAAFLNACHACHRNHPWYGKDGNPFQNLAFMAQGRIRSDAIDWLNQQAKVYDRELLGLDEPLTAEDEKLIADMLR